MEKTLEENFRKTIELRNDVMDQMADMMSNGLVIEHKVDTEEKKEVKKKAEERLDNLLREIRITNLGVNYLDSKNDKFQFTSLKFATDSDYIRLCAFFGAIQGWSLDFLDLDAEKKEVSKLRSSFNPSHYLSFPRS